MARYRKKPVEIEAVQFNGPGDVLPILDWMRGGGTAVANYVSGVLVIPTLEGEMTASRGDWIIRGVQGEFYPCKPDIFEATYDPA